jgi:WD40 repeat protein
MPTIRIHRVNSLACFSFGLLLLLGWEVRAWTAESELGVYRLAPLPGETESPVVTAMALSPNGDCMAAAGDDHAIRLTSLRGDNQVEVLVGHQDWVKSLQFSPAGDFLASCGNDGALCVWRVSPQGEPTRLLLEHFVDHALFGVAFGTDSELYAVGFSDSVYRLDIPNDRLDVDHRCDCRDIRALDCSSDGRWLAYGGRDGILRLKSLSRPEHVLTGAPTPPTHGNVVTFNAHFARIQGLHFSDDSKSVLSVGEDRRLVQSDIGSRKVVGQLEIGAGKLLSVCPLIESYVAVSGSDNTIRVVDVRRFGVVSKLVGHDGSIAILRRNGTHLFSGGYDTTIRSWTIDDAIHRVDDAGRFVHPISAQFEDSSAQERIR